MEILYAAAEMVPFAKVGGLADVAGALTGELARAGHRVVSFLPLYPSVRGFWTELKPEKAVDLQIQLGGQLHPGRVYRTRSSAQGVELLLLENEHYFDRPNPYVNPESGRDWPDNAERFVFLSRAILETCAALDWAPDIFHLNDYQVGLVAPLLAEEYTGGVLRRSATVLSVHNLGYQGIYPADGDAQTGSDLARDLGFGHHLYRPLGPLEYYGRLNFTKAALVYADMITTVSPTYAREIQTETQGCGLDGVLRQRTDRVVGILNGIDAATWDPARDPLLPFNYGPSDFRGKARNKERLLAAMHLPEEPQLPLLGMISRLVDQKGLDLLMAIAEPLLLRGVLRLVVLGRGMPKYERGLKALARQFPNHCAVCIGFDEPLAHLIEAGCDFFLMPSQYEPCGLSQMYSMRYGTVPIVRATGGLADTVEDFDARTGRGRGFAFEEYSPEALLEAIERALAAYRQTNAFKSLVARIMRLDFSWARAAQAYEQVYEQALRHASMRTTA